MKILLIDVYNFNKGGAESVCFNTGNMLEEHGNEVVYFTLKWKQNSPSPFEKYFPKSKETPPGECPGVGSTVNSIPANSYFLFSSNSNSAGSVIGGLLNLKAVAPLKSGLLSQSRSWLEI